jgi:hypothetical protein
MSKVDADQVPAALRRWFVAHFWVDLAFALPLLFVPGPFLHALGWSHPDPVASRLVGAALAAIGGQSLLGRNEGARVFQAMLSLKCLWSAAAVLGLALAVVEGAPDFTWAILAVFMAFAGVWNYYRIRLRQLADMADD